MTLCRFMAFALVTYQLEHGHAMTIVFWACDVDTPVVSVASLRRSGYGVVLDKETFLTYDSKKIANIYTVRGMFSLFPQRHQKPKFLPANLVAPIHDEGAGAQEDDRRRMQSEDIRPPTMIQGRRRSGMDDYWVFKDDIAIRVHRRPRRRLVVPSPGITGHVGEPVLSRLGPQRTTRIKYQDNPDEMHMIDDEWLSDDTARPMPGLWTGETEFPLPRPGQTGTFTDTARQGHLWRRIRPEPACARLQAQRG